MAALWGAFQAAPAPLDNPGTMAALWGLLPCALWVAAAADRVSRDGGMLTLPPDLQPLALDSTGTGWAASLWFAGLQSAAAGVETWELVGVPPACARNQPKIVEAAAARAAAAGTATMQRSVPTWAFHALGDDPDYDAVPVDHKAHLGEVWSATARLCATVPSADLVHPDAATRTVPRR
jgi:hypothetical protein